MRLHSMSGVDDCLLFKTEEERQQWYNDAAKYWQVLSLTSSFVFVLF